MVVDADYESEWYLTPMSFATYDEALRFAACIAWDWGEPSAEAPEILIRCPDRTARLLPGTLIFTGLTFMWFER